MEVGAVAEAAWWYARISSSPSGMGLKRATLDHYRGMILGRLGVKDLQLIGCLCRSSILLGAHSFCCALLSVGMRTQLKDGQQQQQKRRPISDGQCQQQG